MPLPLSALHTLLKSPRKTLFRITTVTSVLAFLVFWAPEGWATQAANQVLTTNLEAISTLTSGSIAKTGLIVGTIIGTLTGIFKQSVAIVLICMGMCITLSYFLQYLAAWGT